MDKDSMQNLHDVVVALRFLLVKELEKEVNDEIVWVIDVIYDVIRQADP